MKTPVTIKTIKQEGKSQGKNMGGREVTQRELDRVEEVFHSLLDYTAAKLGSRDSEDQLKQLADIRKLLAKKGGNVLTRH